MEVAEATKKILKQGNWKYSFNIRNGAMSRFTHHIFALFAPQNHTMERGQLIDRH